MCAGKTTVNKVQIMDKSNKTYTIDNWRWWILLKIKQFVFFSAIKITGDTFLNQGETLFLLCTANGIKYIPDDIQWFREGEPMATDYTRINIKEHVAHNAGIITSSIEIRHTSSDDGGTYVCRASSRTESLNIIASVKVHILLGKFWSSKRRLHASLTILIHTCIKPLILISWLQSFFFICDDCV